MYAAMFLIRAPDGVQRATGVLSHFPCPARGTTVCAVLRYGRDQSSNLPNTKVGAGFGTQHPF
jgi:hypothetical protein